MCHVELNMTAANAVWGAPLADAGTRGENNDCGVGNHCCAYIAVRLSVCVTMQ